MSPLDDLQFVKSIPKIHNLRGGKSPLERAREKLHQSLNVQIKIVENPDYKIPVRKPNFKTGELENITMKPKSWVTYQDDTAFITLRYSNKVIPIGGKRGAHITCHTDNVTHQFQTIKAAIDCGALDDLLEKIIKKSKRGNKK